MHRIPGTFFAVPFHLELKDGREIVRAFNLSEEDVRRQVILPLRAGVSFTYQEKDFEPRKARLVVMEGDHLAPGMLGLGQGWTNACKLGTDVTQRFLSEGGGSASPGVTLEISGRLRERLLGRLAAGPLALGDGVGLTTDLLEGHRVSERLAAVEIAVWEMLHSGAIDLAPDAESAPLGADQWESVVLDPATWLASGPGSPVISARA